MIYFFTIKKSLPWKYFQKFNTASSLFRWKIMWRLDNFHPVAFLFVEILIRSIFVLNQIPKHEQELNHRKVLQRLLHKLFNKLHKLRMSNFKKFCNLYTFNFISSFELVLSDTKEIQILNKKSSIQQIILFLCIINLKVVTIVKKKSFHIREYHS